MHTLQPHPKEVLRVMADTGMGRLQAIRHLRQRQQLRARNAVFRSRISRFMPLPCPPEEM